jgi:hypothetical protein
LFAVLAEPAGQDKLRVFTELGIEVAKGRYFAASGYEGQEKKQE